MTVGNLPISPPFVLAPMDGFTDRAFRRVCLREGAGLVYTEMIPAIALVRRSKGAISKALFGPEDHPVIVQIVGADPEIMAEAAKMAEEAGADGVDINAGCPSRKVTNGGAGAALLSNLSLLEKILQKVRSVLHIPLTLKVRAGPTPDRLILRDLATIVDGAGVDAVAIHARTRAQGFRGLANWGWISALREVTKVPVIGNGDVKTVEDAIRMMKETGCDGVMIGRAAIGNPWIFRALKKKWEGGEEGVRLTKEEWRKTVLFHFEEMVRDLGGDERKAAILFRKHLTKYVKGMEGAGEVRRGLPSIVDRSSLEKALDLVWKGPSMEFEDAS